jgi:3-phosphoshikimate 1-carboxyvinyltransferase
MLASIAGGRSRIEGFATSADCRSTLGCLNRLGIAIEEASDHLFIHGNGLRGYRIEGETVRLDAGNSGSTMRMLSGLLAAHPFRTVIDGDLSLRRRPMGRIIEPLRRMGCQIEAREGNLPPLIIRGGALDAISYSSPVASAQVKSCVLLAGLHAKGATTFREPAHSRNHTELMLAEFGARFSERENDAGRVLTIEGGAELTPVDYRVPGDLSSASFFIAAATLLPGSSLLIQEVNLNPTRSAFLDILESLGANILREDLRSRHGEMVGNLRVTSSALRSNPGGTILSGALIASLVDELPILAVVATQVEGRVEVRDARELRIKESDRIRSVVDGIRGLEGNIDEFEDGFSISGPQQLSGGRIETSGDHRIAMAFTVAGLIADGVTEISDADCVGVSFPEFYDSMSSVSNEGSIIKGSM